MATKAATTPAATCAIQYGTTSFAGHLPRRKTASVTAGLRCPPEMCPVAKTMTMSAAPIASGAITPAAPGMTVQPTVRTRKNVPINSAIYLFIAFGAGCLEEVSKVESSRLHRGYGEPGKVGRRNTEMRIGKGEMRKAEGKRKVGRTIRLRRGYGATGQSPRHGESVHPSTPRLRRDESADWLLGSGRP